MRKPHTSIRRHVDLDLIDHDASPARARPVAEIEPGFEISESCLRMRLAKAEIEDGRRPGVTTAESVVLRS